MAKLSKKEVEAIRREKHAHRSRAHMPGERRVPKVQDDRHFEHYQPKKKAPEPVEEVETEDAVPEGE